MHKRDVGLCIGYLPGRVRPAIFVEDGVRVEVLAYFRGEDEFARFKELIGGSGLVQVPVGAEDQDA